ncbi:hypothetical protein SBV1_10006 [Verrucomicrobia bacterium]|nr:hypothetical protein SBV1_10006 [Verrucomicrobiota bacterium]
MAVRRFMTEAALDLSALAKASGMTPKSLSDALVAGVPFAATRARIEKGFGYRYPIWSNAQDLDDRRLCMERFQFDPVCEGVRFLRKIAPRIGADFSGCFTKAQMERVCFHRAAATPATLKAGVAK